MQELRMKVKPPVPPIKCACGFCSTCRHRDYMRAYRKYRAQEVIENYSHGIYCLELIDTLKYARMNRHRTLIGATL